LEHFTGDVEREVLRVDDSLDEREPLGDELITVVHDEDAANVQLDVVLLLLGLKHVHWSATGDKENGAELELTFNREVLDREMVFPVIGEGLVEGGILFSGNVLGVASPKRVSLWVMG
jgi:hypothetical protein